MLRNGKFLVFAMLLAPFSGAFPANIAPVASATATSGSTLYTASNAIDPFSLKNENAGWRAYFTAQGTIEHMEVRYGWGWKKVTFRSDKFSGPKWYDVPFTLSDSAQHIFTGTSGSLLYTIQYKSINDVFSIIATIKNTSNSVYTPDWGSSRFALGLNTEMSQYPAWDDIYFPTLLRCEKTHFWGYVMDPKGEILSISSPDPIASWNLEYNGGGHLIYTFELDLLHKLPLPARHPQTLTTLNANEEKSWTIQLQPLDSLSQVKPTIAAQIGAPLIDADHYTVGAGEPIQMKIYSTSDISVSLKNPAGTNVPVSIGARINNTYAFSITPGNDIGVYTLTAVNGAGKTSEAMLSVRQPYSWYAKKAREGAILNHQNASDVLEQWLGLHSGFCAMKYFPEPDKDNLITERLQTILSLQWDANGHPINMSGGRLEANTAQMVSVLVDAYLASKDITHLEKAVKLATFVISAQSADGDYGGGYTAVFYPVKSLMELMAVERKLFSQKSDWLTRYNVQYASVQKAIDFLVLHKDNLLTEGELTFEDGMLSTSTAQIALFALMQTDTARRRTYTEAAEYMSALRHPLDQLLTPDSRMNGSTLRFWEAQYDVLESKKWNMMTSPHGWSAWNIYGTWYLYLLTGKEKYLNQAMNAVGSTIQVIDGATGEQRWGFTVDPYLEVSLLKANSATPGRGVYYETTVGEQYIPMIGSFHYPSPNIAVPSGDGFHTGWACNNDVNEIFKSLEEVALASAYVLEKSSGEMVSWNCSVVNQSGKLIITPNESVVSGIHLNFKQSHAVEIHLSSGTITGNYNGMRWVGSGGYPDDLYLPFAHSNSAFERIEAENYDGRSGMCVNACDEGGQDLGCIGTGDYAMYENIDFGAGAKSFIARIGAPFGTGNISVILDDLKAAPVGVLANTTNTGSWETFTTVSTPITPTTGRHDVYLQFETGINLNWFTFGKDQSGIHKQPAVTKFEALLHNNRLRISLPWKAETKIRLVSITGQSVFAATISGTSADLAIGDIPRGVYLLEAKSDVGMHAQRLIKN